jgi:putative protease
LQRLVKACINKGIKKFVLNAPWQQALLPEKSVMWAGPFCNITNPLAIYILKKWGFNGVIVSPELGEEDFIHLPPKSCLPMGIVLSGNWPLCISRISLKAFKPNIPFKSPRGEAAWIRRYDQNQWVYPNWAIDISDKRRVLVRSGYSLFIHLPEPVPPTVKIKKRPGKWNWDIGLR